MKMFILYRVRLDHPDFGTALLSSVSRSRHFPASIIQVSDYEPEEGRKGGARIPAEESGGGGWSTKFCCFLPSLSFSPNSHSPNDYLLLHATQHVANSISPSPFLFNWRRGGG